MRTLVEIETDDGLVGVGEMGGGGESAHLSIQGLKPYLIGHDPKQLELLRWKVMNPTASLYNNRMQLHAALEFACIDLIGKKHDLRACDLLGGALRERVPFASYLFYRHLGPDGAGGEASAQEMVAHAKDLVEKHGFTTHKLKGGVFAPDHDVEVYRALAAEFPDAKLRLDPNSVWSVEESVRVAKAISDLNNDYLEDFTFGLEGMRRLRHFTDIPTATNTVVVNFEQLAANVRLQGSRRGLARHDLLGRTASGAQGGSGARDVPVGHRGPLFWRARRATRDDAAPRRRATQPRLRR